jgi:hypothetical protein
MSVCASKIQKKTKKTYEKLCVYTHKKYDLMEEVDADCQNNLIN